MEVSKFRRAMRPKKYLTRDFVVYQDPKMLAARSEMQEGGRVGFANGSDVINYEKYKKIIEQIKKDRPKRIGKAGSTPLFQNNKKFQKIVKELTNKNIPIKEAAKNLGVGREAIEKARIEIGLQKRSDVGGYNYLDDPKNIKYIKDNYGDKKQSTMARELFPDSPETTSVRRIERLIEKHVPKKMGFSKEAQGDPTEAKEKIKKQRQSTIKKLSKTSDLNLERDLKKLKKGMGVDLAHLQRKTLPQTTSNIGMDIPASNRGAMEVVEKIVSDLESTNKKFYNKYKNKKMPKDIVDKIELNNQKIIDLVYKSKGAVVGNILNEKTGKTQEYIGSYRYSADDGLFDLPMKKIAKDPEKLQDFKVMALSKAQEIAKLKGKTVEELYPDLLKDPKIKSRTEQILKSKNLFKELDVDPETREILNRLNNKLSMNPFDAEGLFKDEITKMKKIGTPAAKFIGGVLGGLIAEVGFEAAFAIPAYARGEDFDEILGNTLFGLAGAGKTRQEKVVEESGFDPDVVKYADLVNRKKQFIADAGFVEYFGKPGGDTGYGEIFSPGEKSPLEKRLIENAQIIDKELDQLKEGSPLEQKFKKAEEKLEKRYAEKVEGSTPRKFLKETGESVIDYFKDEEERFNRRMNELERLGFKRGGFGKIGRRSFIKLAAGIAAIIGGLRGGVKQLKTPAAKKVLTDAPTGTPDWFAPLVDKIMKEGIDISDKAATIERQVVKELKTPDGTYTITETPDTGEIIVSVDTGAGVNDFPVDFTMTPNKVTGIADDGTPITEFGEFNIIETRAEGRLVSPDGDYDIEPGEYVTNDLDDAASDWHSVEKFATGKTDEIAQKKKQDGKEFIEKNPNEDIVNRYGDYDPPEPDLDYD